MSAAKNLWANFETMTDLSYVLREGFIRCKVYQCDNAVDSYGEAASDIRGRLDMEKLFRMESSAEHSARVANLLSEMIIWYPMYFPGIDPFLATKTMLNHDIGEVIVGDVPDDGGRPHDLKADAEWKAVKSFYNHLPDDYSEKLLDYHRQFEDCNTLLGQMLKMADKVDAIGKLIIFEGKGLTGSIFFKDPPSQQDIRFANEIGTGNCTDVWARHLEWLFDTQDFRHQVITVAKRFLEEGLWSINRPFYPWWTI